MFVAFNARAKIKPRYSCPGRGLYCCDKAECGQNNDFAKPPVWQSFPGIPCGGIMIQSKNYKFFFHLLASAYFLSVQSVSLHSQNSTGARSLAMGQTGTALRSEKHTSELRSLGHAVC